MLNMMLNPILMQILGNMQSLQNLLLMQKVQNMQHLQIMQHMQKKKGQNMRHAVWSRIEAEVWLQY